MFLITRLLLSCRRKDNVWVFLDSIRLGQSFHHFTFRIAYVVNAISCFNESLIERNIAKSL